MRLLAIDPGNEQSALLTYDTISRRPTWWAKMPNEGALSCIQQSPASVLAVEMVASYGMAVGATVFDTCVAIGRFLERWVMTSAPGIRPALRVSPDGQYDEPLRSVA